MGIFSLPWTFISSSTNHISLKEYCRLGDQVYPAAGGTALSHVARAREILAGIRRLRTPFPGLAGLSAAPTSPRPASVSAHLGRGRWPAGAAAPGEAAPGWTAGGRRGVRLPGSSRSGVTAGAESQRAGSRAGAPQTRGSPPSPDPFYPRRLSASSEAWGGGWGTAVRKRTLLQNWALGRED